jgi:hypothetical protein
VQAATGSTRVPHGSGLVTRVRDRRTVLCRRTEQGDAPHG